MFASLKADLYRMRKERLSLVATIFLGLFTLAMTLGEMGDKTVAGAESSMATMTLFLVMFFLTPAKIFFGEEYANRTINNFLIKHPNRFFVFTYKWLAMMSLSLAYVLGVIALITALRLVTVGQFQLLPLLAAFVRQLPFYLVAISICGTLMTILPKLYQTYVTYILLALLFDQIFLQLSVFVLKTPIFAPFLMFNQLHASIAPNQVAPLSIGVALVSSLAYYGVTYYLFSKREFK
ncbi:hypothetical protein [Streptococcus ovis]|uniref:hypothetical protein n=1 Tax=Streptococcus ovis TaxID=82806 RepID=UPI0003792199|nr:hypothetical protein [Streptococcus ovis]